VCLHLLSVLSVAKAWVWCVPVQQVVPRPVGGVIAHASNSCAMGALCAWLLALPGFRHMQSRLGLAVSKER
jgi:hypothetical protein